MNLNEVKLGMKVVCNNKCVRLKGQQGYVHSFNLSDPSLINIECGSDDIESSAVVGLFAVWAEQIDPVEVLPKQKVESYFIELD